MLSIALTIPLLAGALSTGPIAPASASVTRALAPHEAILGQVRALRNDDLGALIRSFVTDEQFDEMEAAWEEERKRTPDATENAEFTELMERYSDVDAETKLWPDVEVALDEMRPQMDMMVGMFSSMAEAALQNESSISSEDQEEALAVMKSLQATLLKTDLTDPDLARKALAVTCDTVRSLKVKDLDDVYDLTFSQLLDRAGLGLRGAKKLLAIYGLEINGWLSSCAAETLHTDGDYAVVRLEYSILGMNESSEIEMTRIAGRWFTKESVDQAASLGK